MAAILYALSGFRIHTQSSNPNFVSFRWCSIALKEHHHMSVKNPVSIFRPSSEVSLGLPSGIVLRNHTYGDLSFINYKQEG